MVSTHNHTHTMSVIIQYYVNMCDTLGAGKTSTFSMLTGDISPTSGTAIISGYDIRTDLRKVRIYSTLSSMLLAAETNKLCATIIETMTGFTTELSMYILISMYVGTTTDRLLSSV